MAPVYWKATEHSETLLRGNLPLPNKTRRFPAVFNLLYHMSSPIPIPPGIPPPPPEEFFFSSGISATAASVMSRTEAADAAFSTQLRVTFTGSMMPASTYQLSGLLQFGQKHQNPTHCLSRLHHAIEPAHPHDRNFSLFAETATRERKLRFDTRPCIRHAPHCLLSSSVYHRLLPKRRRHREQSLRRLRLSLR